MYLATEEYGKKEKRKKKERKKILGLDPDEMWV